MNNITIKMLTEKDAHIYRLIRLKALDENPENYLTSYDEEKQRTISIIATRLSQENTKTLGAFSDNQLVGIITLSKENRVKTHHISNIFAMYVDCDYRRLGIGKLLIKKAIEIASLDHQTEKIRLSVTHTNMAAISLYNSFGFKVYGTEHNAIKYENEYYHSVMMDLILNK